MMDKKKQPNTTLQQEWDFFLSKVHLNPEQADHVRRIFYAGAYAMATLMLPQLGQVMELHHECKSYLDQVIKETKAKDEPDPSPVST